MAKGRNGHVNPVLASRRRTTIAWSASTSAGDLDKELEYRPQNDLFKVSNNRLNRLRISNSQLFKMRTYDDTFSGQKIYPGKVRSIPFFITGRFHGVVTMCVSTFRQHIKHHFDRRGKPRETERYLIPSPVARTS